MRSSFFAVKQLFKNKTSWVKKTRVRKIKKKVPTKTHARVRALKNNQYKLLWMILSLLGTIYQVYNSSNEYFTYEINTNVQLIREKDLEIPKLILCFDVLQTLKWEEMTHEERLSILHRENGDKIMDSIDVTQETEENIAKIASIFQKITTRRTELISNVLKLNLSRVFELSYETSDITEYSITYFENNTELMIRKRYAIAASYSDIFTVKEFVKDLYKCHSFEMKEQYQRIKFYHVMRKAVTPGVINMMQFNA